MSFLFRNTLAATLLATSALALPAATVAAEPVTVGATFLTNGVDPSRGNVGWSLISFGVGEKLFAVDKDGVLVPEAAESAEQVDANTWLIKLRADRKFSDGTPVNAENVGAALTHTIAENAIARATGGELKFEAVDELTLKVTTEKPVAVIQALFAEWPMIVYHLKEDGSTVFGGPYAIADYAPDASLTLTANPNYPDAETRADVTVRKFGDAQSIALAFEAGELDLAFGLPSESIARLKANPDLIVKSFPVGYQYFAWLNVKQPLLADPLVRQAVDLAFNREELAAAINAGEPATSAYAAYFPFAVKEPRTFDAEAAKAKLDEAGWVPGADGVREKDGERLSLRVLAYPQRPDLVTFLPVAKAQLAAVGIDVQTAVVENAGEVASAGDYDLFMWAQHTAPSGDPAFFLDSMLRSGASLNYSGYASEEFDAILDRFGTEGAPEARGDIARAAHEVLFRDVPVSFLVAPVWHVGLSQRLANYEPWGSDYHVLRADIGDTAGTAE